MQKMEKCIELDRYCADMCRMAAGFMARSDEHTKQFVSKFCLLCAEICDACGNECAMHAHDHCKACAEACKKCAEECRSMARG